MTDTLRNMPRYIRNTDAFGWQGADGPNGPWRSIAPPQSGTPWQTSSPMDDLRQASADVSGVELEPGWRQETANKLSPAAQAGLDAAVDVNDLVCTDSIAAALRAAADQVVPKEPAKDPLWESAAYRQRADIRAHILAIAAELEGKA